MDDLEKCSVESEEKRLSKQNKIYPKDENHSLSKGFFELISRNKLCTEIKWGKKSQKSMDTVKEDM